MLEAFRGAAAGDPRLTLDLVGTGPLFGAVSDYVAAHGLGGRVRLHGAMPNGEVQRLMGEADIFVQHSVTCPVTGDQEGLPVAILAAMAARLLQLAGDRGAREAMGREGRSIVEQRYTWETEKRSLLALVEAHL